MVKIIEITATMIIVFLGTKIEEYYKSDLVELHLLNGNIKGYEQRKHSEKLFFTKYWILKNIYKI